MFDFTGKVVVVTGGEKGIGRATVEAFAGQGAQVVIAGRDRDAGQEVASQFKSHVVFCDVDVTKEADTRKLATFARSEFGPVTTIVNNAGIHTTGNVLTTSEETWRRILEVNLTGVYLVTHALLPQMIERGGGVIVNVASEAGLVAIPDQIAYNVSKTAIIGFTKSVAIDFAQDGVRANAICPGTTHTPLVEAALLKSTDPAGLLQHLESSRPANRLGRPEEIAAAVIALASDDIGYATGAVFSVDGGLTAQ